MNSILYYTLLVGLTVLSAVPSVAALTKREQALRAIEPAAREFGVSADLMMAIAFVESSYRPWVVSSSNAVGLMQVKPSTAKWIVEKEGERFDGELTDPAYNAKVAARYLRYLEGRFGTVGAVQAYHVGPGAYLRGESEQAAEKYLASVFEALVKE